MPEFKTDYINKETTHEELVEQVGILMHKLNYILNNLDADNMSRDIVTKSSQPYVTVDGVDYLLKYSE